MSSYYHQDFARTPDGANLFFEARGDGAPAMVLCDGLGCDGFAWKYLLPKLAARHRVLHWHYRGHGQSSLPVDPTRIGMDRTLDDLVRVMDAAHVEKGVLFGHSMGVQVALEFHRRHPERVVGLVLLCGSYGHPLDTFHDTTWLKRALPWIRKVVETFPHLSRTVTSLAMRTQAALELAITLELNRALLKKRDMAPYFHHMARMDPVVFLRTLASLAEHTAADHLPSVDVPTLVIGGEQDHFTPAWLSEKMAERIPGARLLMVKGGSHTAPLESPDAIWASVESFLSELLPSHAPAQTSTSPASAPSGEPVPKRPARKKAPRARKRQA